MSESTVADSALDHLVALEVAGLVLRPGRGPQLYRRCAGDAFPRDASVMGTLVDIGDAANLEFSVAPGTVDYLRFDLPAVAGCYRMGPVAIDGIRVEDLARRVVMVHGQRLQDPESAAEIRVADWSSAPWFELDVRALLGSAARAEPIKVRIAVRKEHAAIEMDRRLDAALAQVSRQLEAHGQAIRSAMEEVAAANSLAQLAAHDRLHAGLLEVHSRIDRLDRDTAQSLTALAAQAEAFRQSSTAQAESSRRELAALHQQLEATRSQLDFLTQYELNRSLVRRALRRVKRIFRP